jgi:hypothetical protein
VDQTAVLPACGEPPGTPLLVESQSESVWMCFLAHCLTPFAFV